MTLSKLFNKSYNDVNFPEGEFYHFDEFAEHIENLFIFEGFELTHRELFEQTDKGVVTYRKTLYLKKWAMIGSS